MLRDILSLGFQSSEYLLKSYSLQDVRHIIYLEALASFFESGKIK